MRELHGTTWFDLPNVVYIGMPGKAQRGVGIPDHKVLGFGKPWNCLDHPDGWRAGYQEYLQTKLKIDPVFRQAVKDLAGQTLVCWCKGKKHHKNPENNIPDPDCHGDLLAVTAERLAESNEQS